jgi:signal transduction histidine kinase
MMNAAQAMKEGGSLTIATRAANDVADPSARFVEAIFRDTGCGIPKEKFELLFQPFYTEGKEGGTGLGLSISKSIVEKHKGCIYFESEVGKGTTFFIRLPVAV